MGSDETVNAFKRLLAEFGASVELEEELRTDENGVCTLVFDERIHLNIMPNPNNGQVIFASPLALVDPERRESVYEQLLKANLFWRETGGGTIGITPDASEIILAYQRPLDSLDVPGLRETIEFMVEHAEQLLNTLQAPMGSPVGAVPGETPPPAWNRP
jgi:Tir chaperone protein (CesT).